MKAVQLGHSDLHVTPICLGTMTFGEQVNETDAHAILARSLERGVNFLDTAEMYAVPVKAETFTLTETIIGRWFAQNPGMREQWIVATKVAGPSRGMPWVRGGSDQLSAQDILSACDASLKRLNTDVIDLYQIHWPTRPTAMFGKIYYETQGQNYAPIIEQMHEQLGALAQLVNAGKVKAIGLSNETPFGVHEFIRMAEQHDLPRVATVQNPYSLVNRSYENGLDETMHLLGVSLLAYSPLAFGMLSGKYEGGARPAKARLTEYSRFSRYFNPQSEAACSRYVALAREHGLDPAQMALAFVTQQPFVTSNIIGATSLEQLDSNIASAELKLSKEVLEGIEAIQKDHPNPAP